MKIAKGFGGKYFSLSAITATANDLVLLAQRSRIRERHLYISLYSIQDSDKEEYLDELLESLIQVPCATKKIL